MEVHLGQDQSSRIKDLIKTLDLKEHPEGGYYSETYKSVKKVANEDSVLMTSIYFLLTSEQVSHFHRISHDELWFFHEGSPLSIHLLENDMHVELILGKSFGEDCRPQHLVKGNVIFGSAVLEPNSYTLVSCVVSPGFEFKGFELFSYDDLITSYPNESVIIDRLTP
ncbi:MAG: cupin domain-containing protein [Crocinitomicaceae bacterium]|jgi:predicted cupin superfamily sugar epimerase|tara:strand:- start:17951 stop:18451 length:501 start_codon:yes stop_codon:yes gene_type:complete